MAVLLIIIIIIAISIFGVVLSNKMSNKIHKTVMKSTGLGNALNENFDKMNAKALAKLDDMLKEGKITQEQYEKRKKNLLSDFDFNE